MFYCVVAGKNETVHVNALDDYDNGPKYLRAVRAGLLKMIEKNLKEVYLLISESKRYIIFREFWS